MRHPSDYPHLFPDKKFGQHFIVSPVAVNTIVDHAIISPEDIVLEVGPGIGALSEQIIPRARRTVLIETDSRLISFLRKEFKSEIKDGKVVVINADARFVNYKEIVGKEKFKVISNLPYNVSIPILFNLFEYRDQILLMTLTFQREVARRIIASPGERKFGVLTINTQMHAEIYKVLELSPDDFTPPPKVFSTVLNFNFLAEPRVAIEDLDFFQVVVRALFARKRRKVINSLTSSNIFSGVDLKRMFLKTGIDSCKRPEDLSFEELKGIHDYLLPFHRSGES